MLTSFLGCTNISCSHRSIQVTLDRAACYQLSLMLRIRCLLSSAIDITSHHSSWAVAVLSAHGSYKQNNEHVSSLANVLPPVELSTNLPGALRIFALFADQTDHRLWSLRTSVPISHLLTVFELPFSIFTSETSRRFVYTRILVPCWVYPRPWLWTAASARATPGSWWPTPWPAPTPSPWTGGWRRRPGARSSGHNTSQTSGQ